MAALEWNSGDLLEIIPGALDAGLDVVARAALTSALTLLVLGNSGSNCQDFFREYSDAFQNCHMSRPDPCCTAYMNKEEAMVYRITASSTGDADATRLDGQGYASSINGTDPDHSPWSAWYEHSWDRLFIMTSTGCR